MNRSKGGNTMKNLCGVCKIVGLFVVVGAINWGLVGVFHFNLVDKIFGEMSMLSRVVYGLVGISGLLFLASYFKTCPKCCTKT